MRIHDWPADERPREKLLKRGVGALSDAELLSIFLGSGLRGHDAVSTARRLLTAHGPLRRLLELGCERRQDDGASGWREWNREREREWRPERKRGRLGNVGNVGNVGKFDGGRRDLPIERAWASERAESVDFGRETRRHERRSH